jgi:hypothetical protein
LTGREGHTMRGDSASRAIGPAESKTLSMRGRSMHENREIPSVQGFFNYHAVPGNRDALNSFRTLVTCAWLRALRRRSQKGRKLTWDRMKRLIATWIPTAKVLHPYPNQRLAYDPR